MTIGKKMNLRTILFIIAVAVAVYSQFPNVDKDILSTLNRLIWIVFLGFVAISERKVTLSSFLARMLLVLGIFTAAEYTLQFFGVINSVGLVSLFPIPIAVYYISYITADDMKECERVINIYWIMVITMTAAIAMIGLSNISSWLATETYMYDGSTHKNSTAQLLGCGFIITFLYFKSNGFWRKIAKLLLLSLFVISLLYVQSRSSLLILAILIIFMGFFQQDNKHRLLYFLALAVVIVIALNSDQIIAIIRQAFFIDKYSSGSDLDLNRFSSGRLYYYKNAWQNFLSNPFVGIGSSYVDNFYLLALETGGILLGVPLIGVYIYRVYLNVSGYRACGARYKNIARLAVIISFYYLGISIFEGFPPYGPGVAAMFFWMISGFLDGMRDNGYLSEELEHE